MAENKIFLLVDDDSDDREIFEEVLHEVDASVSLQTAANGRQALELLANTEATLPQLIFLDLNMPRMGGKECLRQLKGHSVFKNIPVVIYTTSALATDVKETIEAGAAGFISKPTDAPALKQILSVIVESSPVKLEEVIKKASLVNLYG